MKDIKKVCAGSKVRTSCPGSVSQVDLINAGEWNEDGAGRIGNATGAARISNGRTAVYGRVSSEQQEKEETIASQMEAIERYANAHGFKYHAADVFLDDGYSGKVLRRPGLDKLLDKVYEGCYDNVLILAPDRLARSYGHQIMLLEELQRKGCQAVFVHRPIGSGPDEELLLQMQGVIAQYEHSKILERTRRGKLHRMRRGELVNGQRVFGYRYLKAEGGVPARYEVIDDEARVVRMIFQWYTDGGISLRNIATQVQAQAVATVRGGRWSGGHIGHMLRNSIYMGTGHANKIEAVEPERDAAKQQYRKSLKSSRRQRPRGEWLPFSAPAIVSEETFELAQQRLEQNQALAARRAKRPYLLRGLIKCECCETHMFCDTQSNSYICAHSRPAYARDRGRPPCSNKRRIPVDQLDEHVWREVKAMLKKPALLKEQYPALSGKIHPRAAASLETLDRKLDEVKKQITRTNDLFVSGMLDKTEHATRYRDLETRRTTLSIQCGKVAGEHFEHQEIVDMMASFSTFANTVRARLEGADPETRRSIAEQMLKRVLVGKKGITVEFMAPLKKYNLRYNLQP